MSDNLVTGFKLTVTICAEDGEVLEHFVLVNPANTALRSAQKVREVLEFKYDVFDVGDEPNDE
jgi:hypothetical protein